MTISNLFTMPTKTTALVCSLALCLLPVTTVQAAVDKVTSSTTITLNTPSRSFPIESLLDVGIPTLDDGLYLTDENDTVFPEVRYAEAIYFSNQLGKVR